MDDPREVRRAIRRGEHSGHTAGLAPHAPGHMLVTDLMNASLASP